MRWKLFACALMLPLMASLAARSASEPEGNLIQNPSLSETLETNGLPQGWYRFTNPGGKYSVTVIGEGRTDDRALRLQGEGQYAGATTNKVPLDPTREYASRCWVKVEGIKDTRASLKLDLFDEQGKYLRSTSQEYVYLKEGWQLLSRVDPAADLADVKQIAVSCGLQGNGKATFDDIELVAREPGPRGCLIKNGGMEFISGERPVSWTLATAKNGKTEMVRRQAPVKEGWYALQLVGAADWTTAQSESVPLDRTRKYQLSGWARGLKGVAKLQITYLKDGMYLGNTQSVTQAEHGWTELSMTGEPDKFPEANRIAAAVTCRKNAQGELDAIFDGIVFKAE